MEIKDITKDQILEWLSEHEQAFEDFCNHFGNVERDDECMKVYHVYECFYDEPWYPNSETSKIFRDFDDACKYGNKLIQDALEDGEELDTTYDDSSEFNEECYAVFLGDYGEDDHRIYIDEYEVK